MGNVRLYGATSGYTELAPPAVAPDGVLSLPSGTGTIAKTTDQGLVHINTTTFSAVASVSLNDVFTSTYDNYLLMLSGVASATAGISARLRLSGTDSTAASYNNQRLQSFSTTTSSSRTLNSTSFLLSQMSTVGPNQANTIIYSPNLATNTSITTVLHDPLSTETLVGIYGNSHVVSTAYDGITIFPGSGTITGTIRVYGYKNS